MDKLFFISSIIIAIFFSYLADKKNKKNLLIVSILIFSSIAGFRGISVGIDTKSYYYSFINDFPFSWQFEEPGFRIISTFLMHLFKRPVCLMFIYALATNSLIILRLWDFRKKCNFPVMIFLYGFIFFFETLNIMRQFIAISVIFYSSKLLDKERYFSFFIIVILMTFIHQSSLLALLILIAYLWDKLNLKKKAILFVPLTIIVFLGIIIVANYERGHIINYFSEKNRISNFNITFVYRFLIFIITFFICNGKRNNISVSQSEEKTKEYKTISTLYFVGLFFASMGMFYFVMARFGYFYLIYELLYWGHLTYNKKYKTLYLSMISIFAFYTIGIELVKNGSQIFPYYMSMN